MFIRFLAAPMGGLGESKYKQKNTKIEATVEHTDNKTASGTES